MEQQDLFSDFTFDAQKAKSTKDDAIRKNEQKTTTFLLKYDTIADFEIQFFDET